MIMFVLRSNQAKSWGFSRAQHAVRCSIASSSTTLARLSHSYALHLYRLLFSVLRSVGVASRAKSGLCVPSF